MYVQVVTDRSLVGLPRRTRRQSGNFYMPSRFLRGILRRLFESGGGRYLLEKIDTTSENHFAKRGMLSQAFSFKFINRVPGDYFEFGVWYGESLLIAHRMKRRYRFDEMKLWGFDSFSGLPDIDD